MNFSDPNSTSSFHPSVSSPSPSPSLSSSLSSSLTSSSLSIPMSLDSISSSSSSSASTPTTSALDPSDSLTSSSAEIEYEALPHTSGLYTHMLAGACAGMMEHACMYPLDAIKTRLQIVNPAPQALYHGMTHAITRISATEGLSTLWRGLSSMLLGAAPAHALYFATYEQCKYWVTEKGTLPITTVSAALAGTLSTIVQDAVMNPFDVVKQRMQTLQGALYQSNWHCAKSVYSKEGWRAFYLSYPVTLSMSIPFQSIHFATYETLSNRLNPKEHYLPWVHMTAGGLAGATAAAFTTPLDVIKTVLQTKGDAMDPSIRQISSWKEAIQLIYTRHGWCGFLRGLGPRMLSHVPATAVCWSTYEYFKFLISWISSPTSPVSVQIVSNQYDFNTKTSSPG